VIRWYACLAPIHNVPPERKSIILKFVGVLIAMLASTIPVSILGVQFAMRVYPFWSPGKFSKSGSLLFPELYSQRN
jgi:hypothetical protein